MAKVAERTVIPSHRWRVALYSHDTMGLGHMRRNLLIAQTLAQSYLQATVLVIAGAREATSFTLPSRVECLTLPALRKELDGQYHSRCLDLSLEAIIALRSRVIRAAVEAYEPDVFVVDNVPRGAVRELDPTLQYLRARGNTRCVLGLRDVLDDPAVVRNEWHRAANEEAIQNYFDAVWVYGDPAVYDPVREYGFSFDVAKKVRYAGYLDQQVRLELEGVEDTGLPSDLKLPEGRLVLCLVGGGQDGAHLAEAFAQAELPRGTSGIILTGPFMPSETQLRLKRYATKQPRLQILNFVSEPTLLISRADSVISMGGYNTVSEILSFERRALIVPRTKPRREQLIRAERLRDLGLLDVLHPDEVSPRALTDWLSQEMTTPLPVRRTIDMNGLSRLPDLLEEVVVSPSSMRSLYDRNRGQYVAS